MNDSAPQALSQDETLALIKKQIADFPVLLYMKGTPQEPRCGFSAQTVGVLMECGVRFAFVDVMTHPEIRQTLPGFAEWPTFPQLWVDGALVGGCDIVADMHRKDILRPLLAKHISQESDS